MGEACGVWLNTALVPLKTKGLAMWRILLSESQERMLLAVIPQKLAEARHDFAAASGAQRSRRTLHGNEPLHRRA